MSEQPRISIALCTFNGEKYLHGQMESFLRQTLAPYELVICDDASTDSTYEILEKFSHSSPFTVRIFRNEHTIGVVKNFSQAISLCRGDYIALSDQDDVWLSDKLEACVRRIREAEHRYGSGKPLLVHSDLCLIDSEGRVSAPSFMRSQHIEHKEEGQLQTILARNFVTGCACLCNKALIKESLPFPETVFMHDWWLALIAACRGKILFIPEVKVMYRQHSSNVLGAKSMIWYNIKEFLKPTRRERVAKTIFELLTNARELGRRLEDLSCTEHPFLGPYIDALRNGGTLNAVRVLFLMRVRTQGLLPNLRFFYRIARGQYVGILATRESYHQP